MKRGFVFLILAIFLFAANVISGEVNKMEGLKISSSAFKDNGYIPEKYSCDGKDINPPLSIENVPPQCKSLALIMDDPDAPGGMWVHWVMWNIAPETREIREDTVPPKAAQGLNDFRKHSYGGPCPPRGTHRYFFKLYALDAALSLQSGSTKADIERAMRDHILERAELIGLFKRR